MDDQCLPQFTPDIQGDLNQQKQSKISGQVAVDSINNSLSSNIAAAPHQVQTTGGHLSQQPFVPQIIPQVTVATGVNTGVVPRQQIIQPNYPNSVNSEATGTNYGTDTSISKTNTPQQPSAQHTPNIQPLLVPDNPEQGASMSKLTNTDVPNYEQQSQQTTPQKVAVTKVKLTDELNIFDWFRTTDIINQIAEKAKSSVDSVITALDPGMKEYLYSGGNINIIVISDSDSLVSPIRDAFQSVFGRATVVAARYNPPEIVDDYPVKLACGFDEAIIVAQERIKRLRLDTSNIPQNQVVVVIQPCLVSVISSETASNRTTNGLKLDENLLPKWFLTYSMTIEDPVLGATMNCYSQFIPVDSEIVATAKEANFPENFPDSHLGFAKSINELMATKLNSNFKESGSQSSEWLHSWSGLNETQIVHELSISLAHLYKRKWSNSIN